VGHRVVRHAALRRRRALHVDPAGVSPRGQTAGDVGARVVADHQHLPARPLAQLRERVLEDVRVRPGVPDLLGTGNDLETVVQAAASPTPHRANDDAGTKAGVAVPDASGARAGPLTW